MPKRTFNKDALADIILSPNVRSKDIEQTLEEPTTEASISTLTKVVALIIVGMKSERRTDLGNAIKSYKGELW